MEVDSDFGEGDGGFGEMKVVVGFCEDDDDETVIKKGEEKGWGS